MIASWFSMLPAIASALAVSLLQALWQSTVLGLAAAVVLRAMAGHSAAARHAIGLAMLVAMLALPAAGFVAALSHLDGANVIADADDGVAGILSAALPALPLSAVAPASRSTAWLAGLWSIGVLLMGMRLAGGFWLLGRLRRWPAAALPPAWQTRAEALRRAVGIARPVVFRMLDAIAQPCTAHVLRPVIWLPGALLSRLAPPHIEALVAHELAHVRRLDWLWNALQCVVETLLFFHPAVWLLGRRVRQEREAACDDIAAAACGDALVVAEALAALAALDRSPTLRPAAMRTPRWLLAAGGGALLARVARLVEAPARVGWRWPLSAAALSGLAAIGLLSAHVGLAAPAASSPAADPPHAPGSSAHMRIEEDGFGSSTRMRIEQDGHVHDYRSWQDDQGKLHESWQVDGVARPIDASVRRWLAEHRRAAPLPPLAPVPPPVMPAQAPPAPLPPPTSLTDLPAFHALVDRVGADPAAVARLGRPIRLDDDCGPCRIDDDEVRLTLTAHGPKGDARLNAHGLRVDGGWRYELAFAP